MSLWVEGLTPWIGLNADMYIDSIVPKLTEY